MSVLEKDKIDGIGKGKNGRTLVLMISDHLGWDNEKDHLILLQEKINMYLSFIENEQYTEVYLDFRPLDFEIVIYLKGKPTEKMEKFLGVLNSQFQNDNIKFSTIIK